jgi:DNA-binding GntR family transcriptional regulator
MSTAAAAPAQRLVRTKTSSAVVEYVLEELFAGRLRSGARIDLEEVGRALDVSRIPVREALLILERDGIVSTRYHRGVYVEPFDAESILATSRSSVSSAASPSSGSRRSSTARRSRRCVA